MVTQTQTVEETMLWERDRHWEVHRGVLRAKPVERMTEPHNRVIWRINRQLALQLDPDRFELRINDGRLRRADVTYYEPDLAIVALTEPPTIRGRSKRLEVFDGPLPLVVEVWSPSTGGYDVDEKLPEYERRGDAEIWRLHPFEWSLIARRRRPDGSYAEARHDGGRVALHALPGVTVDLDALFA